MNERNADIKAKHKVAYWRVAVAVAPLVAGTALVGGVTIDADTLLQSEIDRLRNASWLMGAGAFAWVGIIAMIWGVRRHKTPFEIRMVFEQKSRRAFMADAISVLSGVVTSVAVVAMLR